MTRLDRIVVLAFGLAAASAGLAMRAASPTPKMLRADQQQVEQRRIEQLLKRIGRSADWLDRSLDPTGDHSGLDDPRGRDEMGQAVDDFRQAVVRLRDRVRDHHSNTADVEEVLRRGTTIDHLRQRHRLSAPAEQAWLALRADLERLARAFTIPWTWSTLQATAPSALAQDGPRRRGTVP